MSSGDSSGGLFIKDGGVWKLAGINYGVSGPYNTGPTGDGFQATIFDEGGLYKQTLGSWVFTTDQVSDIPGRFYSTHISDNEVWINSVTPEPREYALLMAAGLAGWICYRRVRVNTPPSA